MNPWIRVKEAISLTAVYYTGNEPKDALIRMYVEDLQELDPLAILEAYSRYRKNPRNRKMPLPSDIREMICPSISVENESREAAARIFSAIRKFGWNNPADAREYIGELGWRVVNLQGDWVGLCESMSNHMIPSLQAQYRELAISVSNRISMGHDEMPPALPEKNSKLIPVEIKKLAAKKELA